MDNNLGIEFLFWALLVLAILAAAGGLVIFGILVKLLARTNFWLEELHDRQKEIIRNQRHQTKVIEEKPDAP